jgi:hypothetical protein
MGTVADNLGDCIVIPVGALDEEAAYMRAKARIRDLKRIMEGSHSTCASKDHSVMDDGCYPVMDSSGDA